MTPQQESHRIFGDQRRVDKDPFGLDREVCRKLIYGYGVRQARHIFGIGELHMQPDARGKDITKPWRLALQDIFVDEFMPPAIAKLDTNPNIQSLLAHETTDPSNKPADTVYHERALELWKEGDQTLREESQQMFDGVWRLKEEAEQKQRWIELERECSRKGSVAISLINLGIDTMHYVPTSMMSAKIEYSNDLKQPLSVAQLVETMAAGYSDFVNPQTTYHMKDFEYLTLATAKGSAAVPRGYDEDKLEINGTFGFKAETFDGLARDQIVHPRFSAAEGCPARESSRNLQFMHPTRPLPSFSNPIYGYYFKMLDLMTRI